MDNDRASGLIQSPRITRAARRRRRPRRARVPAGYGFWSVPRWLPRKSSFLQARAKVGELSGSLVSGARHGPEHFMEAQCHVCRPSSIRGESDGKYFQTISLEDRLGRLVPTSLWHVASSVGMTTLSLTNARPRIARRCRRRAFQR
jgi:hypothetical protein